MTRKLFQFVLLTCILLTPILAMRAQDKQFQPLALTAEVLAGERKIALTESWKYQTGDDLTWANPAYDDSKWKTKDNVSLEDWNGIAWARINLNVAGDVVNTPLNLEIRQFGAVEIYLDGKMLGGFGKIGRSYQDEQTISSNYTPFGIVFERSGEHLLAIRFSNKYAADLDSYSGKFFNQEAPIGLTAYLTSLNETTNSHSTNSLSFGYWMMQLAVCFSIGVLHLLLFAFYPKQRSNLFYSLFVLSIGLSILMLILANYTYLPVHLHVFSEIINRLAVAPKYCLLLIFLYTAFDKKVPRRIWFFIAGFVAYYFLSFSFLVSSSNISLQLLYTALTLGANFEAVRIVFNAARKQTVGAWIVLPGIVTRALIGILDAYSASSISADWLTIKELLYPYFDFIGTYGLMLSISVYLARQFAQTNAHLEAQIIREVEHEQNKSRLLIVEAENARRAKELEEAKQLQLSMLPKKLPIIANLEIAAYMKPATEVGGDYYDFHVSADGTLTVAVGDATGHGLKAGSVVTATKSLFNAFAAEENIPNILKQSSLALKKMNLRGLFMALALLKIKNNEMVMSIAGMPSALIYRAATNEVEEIAIRSVPLGSISNFNYQQQKINLETGDVVLLMSDGFPEMFNERDEILGFQKAAEVLPSIAAKSPDEIINQLVEVSRSWAGTRPADDDVTFVVLKIK